MKRHLKSTIIISTIISLWMTTACSMPQASNEEQPEQVRSLQQNDEPESLLEQETIALISDGVTHYVPLLELMKKAGYSYDWDAEQQTYAIGDTDPFMVIKMNTNEAIKEDETVILPANTLLIENVPYLPIESFDLLFNEELDYTLQGSQLYLQPHEEDIPLESDTEQNETDQTLDFADDLEDPAADEEEVWNPHDWMDGSTVDADDIEPVLKNINITNMIKTAKKYIGVPYKFGASTYSSKYKYFDCSSFTRFIYKKYGISLPRTARSQAKKGNTVSRKKLRKGDLLYFYVPGRYKKEKTIGHVGIYIGNRKMIHASPEPKDGVQITNIDKAYWKKTFVKAKRIAY